MFNEILNIITKSKQDGLKTNVDGKETTPDNGENLLKSTVSGKINGSEFKKEYSNIVDDVEAILQKSMARRSQENIVDILWLLKEIQKSENKKTDKQLDTTDIPELEG